MPLIRQMQTITLTKQVLSDRTTSVCLICQAMFSNGSTILMLPAILAKIIIQPSPSKKFTKIFRGFFGEVLIITLRMFCEVQKGIA